MNRVNRRVVLAGTGASLLTACVQAPDWRISDGEQKQPKGGIGGTGIIGTLTDFGSLIINGLRVIVPEGLPVTSALGPQTYADLAIGQTLTIEARRRAGDLTAARVHVMHPVVGPVQSMSDDRRTLVVAGVTVFFAGGVSPETNLSGIVAVSGAWRQTKVIASRVDPVASSTQSSVAGTVRRAGPSGLHTIGSLPVALPSDAAPEHGSFATAYGRYIGGTFAADKVEQGRFIGSAGPLEALSVEGYLAPTDRAPFHTIDGLGHELSSKNSLSSLIGKRVLLNGEYNGRVVVKESEVLSDL